MFRQNSLFSFFPLSFSFTMASVLTSTALEASPFYLLHLFKRFLSFLFLFFVGREIFLIDSDFSYLKEILSIKENLGGIMQNKYFFFSMGLFP